MKKLVSWVEIPAADFKRAVKFYSSILELELKESDFGTEKMAYFPSGEGAISFSPGFTPSENGVLISINTENDLDSTISRIKENGGTIILGKTKIEAKNRGYFSLFIDSEGNKLGLYGNK